MIHGTVVHAAYRTGVKRLLYLGSSCIYPRAGAAADPRGAPADRPARADQRGLRDRQDRRHQALPGLPPPVRLRLHLGHADQPVRAGRQLRPRELARAAGADPQVPRGQGRGPARGDDLGDGHAAPRVPARRRPRRRLPVPDAPLRRGRATSTSAPARTSVDPRARRAGRATSSRPEARLVFDPTKPDGTPRKLLDVSRLHALGWHHRIDLREGIESTYAWFLEWAGTGPLRAGAPLVAG